MSEVLSSEILEKQFGPTGVKVLRQDAGTRIIHTQVIADGQVLELSMVAFKEPGAGAFPDVHREIKAGKSMGKAFAERGIPFRRQILAVYEYGQAGLSGNLARRFGVPGPATVVDVSIFVGPGRGTPYADILEVYSPAVSWPSPGGPVDQRQRLGSVHLTDSWRT